jgi:hypothetical protein
MRFRVPFSCEGCAAACTRIVIRLDARAKVVADLEANTLLVQSDALTPEHVLAALQKWAGASGKEDVRMLEE